MKEERSSCGAHLNEGCMVLLHMYVTMHHNDVIGSFVEAHQLLNHMYVYMYMYV